MVAFGHLAVGVLGNDDGAIHQHADRQDEAVEDHEIQRQAEDREIENGEQERARYGDADQARRTQAERRHHHDHDKNDGGDDVILEVAQQRAHVVGLVLEDRDVEVGGPGLTLGLDQGARIVDRFDDVEAEPFADLQRDGPDPVDPREGGGVAERAAHVGEVFERDDAVAVHLDRQVEDVAGGLEQTRHLDGKAARAGIERTCRDQPVVQGDDVEEFLLRDVVALEPHRIEPDLEELVAIAADVGGQHPR